MTQTYVLRAASEDVLADALAALRWTDMAGVDRWQVGSPLCDVVPVGPVQLEPAVIDPATLEVLTPAATDDRWYLVLRGPRLGADPDEWAAVLSATDPYIVTDSALAWRFQ